VRAVRYHPNRAYGAAIEQVFRCAQRPDLPYETFGRHTIVRTALQDRQAYGCFSFSPATAVKRRARLCGPAYLLAIDKRGPWTVEKQRQDADLCQDTGIKGMHFGPYRAEGSKSLLSPHVFGARGSILGGASAGAEEASQSGMVLMSFPMCCCVALCRVDVAQLSSKVEATSKPSCKIPKAG